MERANVDNAMLIEEKDIKLVGQIGEGAHGVVYEGSWESSGGQVSDQCWLINVTMLLYFLLAKSCCKGA